MHLSFADCHAGCLCRHGAVVLLLAVLFVMPLALRAGGATFYTLNTANGLSANSVLQMVQLPDGRIAVYTGHAVDVYDGQRFTSAAVGDTGWLELPAYTGHTHLYIDDHDNLWVKEHRRMACVDLRRMRQRPLEAVGLWRGVADFYVDSRRRAWLVRGDSVLSAGGGHALIMPREAGRLQDIEALGGRICAFFDTGQLALYGEDGKVDYKGSPFAGDTWRVYSRTSLVAASGDSLLYQVRMGSSGSVLLAFSLVRKVWRTLLCTPYSLHTLTVTASGALYATCPQGYLRIDPVTGKAHSHPQLRLPDGTMLSAGINTVCLDREGGLWLGTYDQGLLYTSPLSGLFDTQPIDIRVSPILASVYLNGEALQTGREYGGRVLMDVTPPYIERMTLAHDQNSIAFRFSTMNYVRPRSTCYRYRFSATGGEWHTVTADTDGSPVDDRGSLYLPFVGLQPGDYVLEVMASTNPEAWGGADVRRVEFKILPPWWATPWAYAAYAVLAALLLWLAFALYGRHVRRKASLRTREEELMQRVKTLTERLNAYEGDGRVVLGETTGDGVRGQQLSPAEAEFVSRVTALVRQNMANQGYTVEQLARDLCMERTGLYRKLTALLDKSPVAFMRSIRLQRAAEMLARGGRSVAEVAEATGFGSPGYFSKCFQAEYGCRPSDYLQAENGRKG